MVIISDLDFINDLNDIARLFDNEITVKVECLLEGFQLITNIEYQGESFSFDDKIEFDNEIVLKRLKKRYAKKHLYDVLKQKTGQFLYWGSLTGIRPVKLFSDTIEEMGEKEAENHFLNFYDVSREKLELLKEIHNVQKKYLIKNRNAADLYIGIPFCKGRCSYCSFFSADIDKNKNLIKKYVETLIKEIKFVKDIIKENQIDISSIYFGGGTPSSIPAEYLNEILTLVKDIETHELTVEAGRPDSINEELLKVLKENNVNRISINPQTANDFTLKTIGRKHTFNDILQAYNIAKSYDFIINMDIIAGLPDEELKDFVNTVDSVVKLKPQNITVHTLALKQGADLKTKGFKHGCSVDKMIDYADKTLHKNGYNAYYMYRQKNTAGNLENIGYSIPNYECIYNIDNMDDNKSIIACGANAVSKRVFEGGRIERTDTPKDIQTYCGKIDTLLKNKKMFFS